MKIRRLIYIAALVAFATSCVDDVPAEIVPPQSEGRLTLEVSSENPLFAMNGASEGNVLFRTRGGEIVLDVLTNQASWSYKAVDAEWLTITADDYFLTLAADRNEGSEIRKATILVEASREGGELVIFVNL